jgi:hypothetical protein
MTEAAPAPLRQASERLRAAREEARLHRADRVGSPEAVHARRCLVDALAAYVAALEARNLPVPGNVLQEIRLYRRLI